MGWDETKVLSHGTMHLIPSHPMGFTKKTTSIPSHPTGSHDINYTVKKSSQNSNIYMI
jgi:hypothetical protein